MSKEVPWTDVHNWATKQLKTKCRALESVALTHQETVVLRGEIKALRALLGLAASDTEPRFSSVKYD